MRLVRCRLGVLWRDVIGRWSLPTSRCWFRLPSSPLEWDDWHDAIFFPFLSCRDMNWNGGNCSWFIILMLFLIYCNNFYLEVVENISLYDVRMISQILDSLISQVYWSSRLFSSCCMHALRLPCAILSRCPFAQETPSDRYGPMYVAWTVGLAGWSSSLKPKFHSETVFYFITTQEHRTAVIL